MLLFSILNVALPVSCEDVLLIIGRLEALTSEFVYSDLDKDTDVLVVKILEVLTFDCAAESRENTEKLCVLIFFFMSVDLRLSSFDDFPVARFKV